MLVNISYLPRIVARQALYILNTWIKYRKKSLQCYAVTFFNRRPFRIKMVILIVINVTGGLGPVDLQVRRAVLDDALTLQCTMRDKKILISRIVWRKDGNVGYISFPLSSTLIHGQFLGLDADIIFNKTTQCQNMHIYRPQRQHEGTYRCEMMKTTGELGDWYAEKRVTLLVLPLGMPYLENEGKNISSPCSEPLRTVVTNRDTEFICYTRGSYPESSSKIKVFAINESTYVYNEGCKNIHSQEETVHTTHQDGELMGTKNKIYVHTNFTCAYLVQCTVHAPSERPGRLTKYQICAKVLAKTITTNIQGATSDNISLKAVSISVGLMVTGILVIFLLWLKYHRSKNSKHADKSAESPTELPNNTTELNNIADTGVTVSKIQTINEVKVDAPVCNVLPQGDPSVTTMEPNTSFGKPPLAIGPLQNENDDGYETPGNVDTSPDTIYEVRSPRSNSTIPEQSRVSNKNQNETDDGYRTAEMSSRHSKDDLLDDVDDISLSDQSPREDTQVALKPRVDRVDERVPLLKASDSKTSLDDLLQKVSETLKQDLVSKL